MNIPKTKIQSLPGALAVSMTTLKTYLRVNGSDEDALLEVMLKSAIKRVENEIKRKLINQTWDIFFDSFPSGSKKNDHWWDGTREGYIGDLLGHTSPMELPFKNISSVTSITYINSAGTENTFTPTNYNVDEATTNSGLIKLKYNKTWPTDTLKTLNAVKVRAVFGYGTGESDVPDDIQMAIMSLVAHMYEHRGDEAPKFPESAMMLLNPYLDFSMGVS